MQRTDVNPWEWSKAFGFSQAVDVRDVRRLLLCSGQTAMGSDGSPPSTLDMGEQLRLTLSNLGVVLKGAGLGFADVVRITIYTTDVDALLPAYGPVRDEFFGTNLPATTLLGVARLAFPELKLEIEATAVGA
jgi:enamine deaminase RidA (YjgF/YER057c/UK114 family)